ncbi:homoserine O-acetyltransferase family protein [Reichenbachiella versicolor]|uniref:homoserine O-acetyltransferase family protein n=1 Tax=Reichenbachiella versicolor TaxID=1821036 RepID=UPI001FEC666E|nr:homoserine O-acetyltransferase [Reichenbachiella versicolor]
MSEKKIFKSQSPFALERGGELAELEVAYHTYGELNSDKSNVVWVFHALTANSECMDWWEGLFTSHSAINPKKHFIVCANILGSPYGTSSPLTINSTTGKPYFTDFPLITIRDMVEAHKLLRDHLDIERIAIGLGGSMGGFQTYEWAVQEPNTFEKIILIGTAPKESPWRISIHATQRLAIEADPTWRDHKVDAGSAGVATSRAIGMLSYRNHDIFGKTQSDDNEKLDDFNADSYIRYQGQKLVKRNFQGYVLWNLTKALDSHNVGRGRGGIEEAFKNLKSQVLQIAITTDLLFPIEEQRTFKDWIPNMRYEEVDSFYGHDGFLTETEKLNSIIEDFIS